MKYLVLFFITILLSACSASSVSCRMKPLKQKRFRVQKVKPVKRSTYSVQRASKPVQTNPKVNPQVINKPVVTAQQSPPVIEEPPVQKEEEVVPIVEVPSVKTPKQEEQPIVAIEEPQEEKVLEEEAPQLEPKEEVNQIVEESSEEPKESKDLIDYEDPFQGGTNDVFENEPDLNTETPETAVTRTGEVYNPNTHVDLNGKVYDKEKNIKLVEEFEFVPNYAIVLYKSDFETKLNDLAKFMQENPEKKAVVFGNGGMEGYNKIDDFMDDGKLTKFGSTSEVYRQYFGDLANVEPLQLQRIEEEGFPVLKVVNGEIVQKKRSRSEVRFEYAPTGQRYLPASGQIGVILQERANVIKRYLVAQGIAESRIIAKKGKFIDREYHDVIIYVK